MTSYPEAQRLKNLFFFSQFSVGQKFQSRSVGWVVPAKSVSLGFNPDSSPGRQGWTRLETRALLTDAAIVGGREAHFLGTWVSL